MFLAMRPTLEAEFRVELRMVCLQGSRNERCIFRRMPAEASANHTRRMALAVEHEPFTVFFAPRLKVSSLFHATLDADWETKRLEQNHSMFKLRSATAAQGNRRGRRVIALALLDQDGAAVVASERRSARSTS